MSPFLDYVMQNRTSVFNLKKSSSTFWWKKIVACRKKSTDDPREESITGDSEENPITEDAKRNRSLRTLKSTLSVRNLRRTLSLWNLKRTLPRGLAGTSGPLMTFASKRTLFGFLIIVRDKEGNLDKFLFENFGLGRPRFHAISHLKLEAKEYF